MIKPMPCITQRQRARGILILFTTPRNLEMKTQAIALSLLLPLASVSGLATPKGCIKGALVGGAVGHVAGGHSVAGAAVGCGVGHHSATVKERQNAAQQNAAQPNTISP